MGFGKPSGFLMEAVLASLIVLGLSPVAIAAGEEGEAATVQGEILDLGCYIPHEAKGPDHKECAIACLKNGQPMGLLGDDGKVYLLLADHDAADAYESAKSLGGSRVEVMGPMAERAGMAAITVQSVKEL